MPAPLPTITVDFETYYDSEYSLKNMSMVEYILNPAFQVIGVAVAINDEPAESFSGRTVKIKEWLAQFDWDNSRVVAHNAQFDCAILSWTFDIEAKENFCTMMGARPYIFPHTGSVSLDNCAKYLTKIVGLDIGEKGKAVLDAKDKMRHDFTPNEMDDYMAYCKQDVDLTVHLYKYITNTCDMPHDEQRIVNLTVRKYISPQIYGDAEFYQQELDQHIAESQLLIAGTGVSKTVLGSNAKFAALLKEHGIMSMPMKVSPTTGKDVFAFAKTDTNFQILMENNGDEINRLCRARLAVKSSQLETRLKRFISILSLTDSMFPVALMYWAAHTGRFGGYDKTNLQNLKRGSVLRKGLVAPKGYDVVAADYSQIEARILAALAGEWDLVKQFASGDDVYSRFAERAFSMEPGSVNKEDFPFERFTGKTSILGLGYQMGAQRFYDTMATAGRPITIEFATDVVNSYRQAYPKIKQVWHNFSDLVVAMASGTKMRYGPISTSKDKLHLPNGMHISYPDLTLDPSTNNYTYKHGYELKTLYGAKLVENVVQALARILMTWAELKLSDHGLDAAMSVHDELVYVVPTDHTDRVKYALDKVMNVPPVWLPVAPVTCEIKSGPNYGKCK